MKRTLSDFNARHRAKKQARKMPSTTAAQMGQIAKKVLLNQAETKSYVSEGTQNVIDNLAKFQNLNYGVTTGGTRLDRIGQKIYLTSIRIKGLYYSNSSSNTSTKSFRVLVIKKTVSLGTGVGTPTLTDIFRSGTTNVVTTAMVDTDKVSVFYDKTFATTPTFGAVTTQTMLRPFEFIIPFGQKEVFTDAGNSELQNGSYFLVLCSYDGNGVLSSGGFNYSWSFNFKDE